jgi:hypothetical protein
MCCFSGQVDVVSGTNIFARPSKDNGQFIVYSMTVKMKEDVAMILPLPTPSGTKEDAVKFINLEKYENFFDELKSGFPLPRSKGIPPAGIALGGPDKKLKVVEVGSFVASFVPTLKDFSRLDAQFRLPEGTWDKLPQYKNYSFAVFKLKKGEHKVHPMAFEFPRADAKKLFFPTVHIHDGKVHDKEQFDHTLYCQGGMGDSTMKWEETPQSAEMFMKNLKEAQGIVSGKDHVYRKNMHGMFKNEDIWL